MDVLANYSHLRAGELALGPGDYLNVRCRVCAAPRRFSRKLAFVVVQALSDDENEPEVQLVVSQERVEHWERAMSVVELVGGGDVVACRGWPGRTKTGKHDDVSIFAHTLEIVRLIGSTASTLRLLRQLEQRRWSYEEAAIMLQAPPELVRTIHDLAQNELQRRKAADRRACDGALHSKRRAQDATVSEGRALRIAQAWQRRQKGFVVVLERLANPTNIAAILRTCDAFGVEEVLIVNERDVAAESTAPHKQELSQLLLRASASAAQWVPRRMFATSEECAAYIAQRGLVSAVTALHHSQAISVYDFKVPKTGIAVWLGNEALGISEEAMANAGVVITIPMRGMVESLNVAAAAAVLMSEITRQTTSTVTQPT